MRWYYKISVWLLMGITMHGIAAQSNVKDSLLKALQFEQLDTVKVQILEQLANETYYANPEEALGYCEQMRLIAEKVNYKDGIANAYGWLAYLYEQRGEIQLALDIYYKSADLFAELNDTGSLATCYNNMAAIYKDRGDIEKAMAFHQKSLALRMAIKDYLGISVSINNIGFIYFGQGRIKETMQYYGLSLKLALNYKDWNGVAISLTNIADVFAQQEEFDKALDYHYKSLDIHKKLGNLYDMAYTYNSIGRIYEKLGKLNDALFCFGECERIRKEIDDLQGLGYVYGNIGMIQFKKGLKQKALENFTKSLELLKQVDDPMGMSTANYRLSEYYFNDGNRMLAKKYALDSYQQSHQLQFPERIRNSANILYQIYEQEQDWRNAFTVYKTYTLMKDSLINSENRKTLIRQELQFEYDRKSLEDRIEREKEKEVHAIQLQKQRIALIAIGGIAILLIALFVAIFKGKQRSDNLLLNILPFEVAKELKQKGKAKTRNYAEVTVLFTDFKGFTQIAEKLSPEELVEEINVCFSAFDNIISKYRIEKIKTIGDAYMAASGLPNENTNHAHNMILAAFEIKEFIAKHAVERAAIGREAFQIRIGIHTGPVVAGIVGNKNFAYDIWGDTVNTASRMESSGEPGEINISDSTYKLVKNEFKFEHRGKVLAKNKGEIDMYFVYKK